MKKWIIEVTAITDAEDLDPDDLDEHGECLVDGAYRLHTDGDLAESDDPQEAALDVFHSIGTLEDYDIIIRKETLADAGDGWLRRNLGLHEVVPTPPALDF